MKKLLNFFMRKTNRAIMNFALAFARGSVQRICFYIFHQPKMPEEVWHISEK